MAAERKEKTDDKDEDDAYISSQCKAHSDLEHSSVAPISRESESMLVMWHDGNNDYHSTYDKHLTPTTKPCNNAENGEMKEEETQDVNKSVITFGDDEIEMTNTMALFILDLTQSNESLKCKVQKMEQESKEDKQLLRSAHDRNVQCQQETQKWIRMYQDTLQEVKELKSQLIESQQKKIQSLNVRRKIISKLKRENQILSEEGKEQLFVLTNKLKQALKAQTEMDKEIKVLNKKFKIFQNGMNNKLKEEQAKYREILDIYTGESNNYDKMSRRQLIEVQSKINKANNEIKDAMNELDETEWKCVICYNQDKNVSTDGCNHIVMCDQCENGMSIKACPRCSKRYTKTKIVEIR